VHALAEVVLMWSLADETPEGRSIVQLAEARYRLVRFDMPGAVLVPFAAQTRMRGVDWDGRSIRKGAVDSVRRWVEEQGREVPSDAGAIVEQIALGGGTPLLVADGPHCLGVVHLKDTVKPGIARRFAEMRAMGIRTVMITGDNRLTAAAIASEAGVDEYVAAATPEEKMAPIWAEQASGELVAMTGDGTNNAPALTQADIGLAMNTGTPAAKEAGNMVDLDPDPTKFLDVVAIGKQLLITGCADDLLCRQRRGQVLRHRTRHVRRGLPTPPAPERDGALELSFGDPQRRHLNAIIIVILIPLALRGVRFRAMDAQAILRRNVFIYGIGGLLAPFVGIKLIDLIVVALGRALRGSALLGREDAPGIAASHWMIERGMTTAAEFSHS
jgi:K+-transporting ATPase ATPase B chain